MGQKHKPAERTAIYEPTTQNLLTDESEHYNVGVLTKNEVQPKDLNDAINKNDLHNKI